MIINKSIRWSLMGYIALSLVGVILASYLALVSIRRAEKERSMENLRRVTILMQQKAAEVERERNKKYGY